MLTAELCVLFVLCCAVVGEDLTLTVLHTNDVHSHFLETDPYGGRCKPEKKARCVGGAARHLALVRKIKASNRNVLFLSAGDYFQGTAFYTLLKYKPVADVVQLLKHDAMCLGNHEFDDGPEGLAPYLKQLMGKVPIVVANADFSADPVLKDLQVNKSITVVIGGHQIGIIGAITPDTATVSYIGKVVFQDDLEAVRTEAKRLKNAGIKIVIAVTHSGYAKEQRIAKEVPEVSLVVGGHSHTFLFSGNDHPSEDKPKGPYPAVVNRTDGTTGLVVQAYWFGKYMGFINVTYDDRGHIKSWRGQPILLNQSYPEDPDMINVLEKYKDNVTAASNTVVGSTKVLLDGRSCRTEECSLGNFIADSLFDFYASQKSASNSSWSDINGAVVVGGTIRGSIAQTDHITMEDLLTVMPYSNTLVIATLTGQLLIDAFEHAVHRYDFKRHPGEFLQISGFRVEYHMYNSPQHRVGLLEALCTNCSVPRHEVVTPDKLYNVAMYQYMFEGGDGYNFSSAVRVQNKGHLDLDIFTEYLKKMSPVKAKVEGRIKILKDPQHTGGSSRCRSTGLSFLLVAIWVTVSSR